MRKNPGTEAGVRGKLFGGCRRWLAVGVVPPQEVSLEKVDLGCHGANGDLDGAEAVIKRVHTHLKAIQSGLDTIDALVQARFESINAPAQIHT
ncbi:MAG: hypothetical protein OXG99_07070 [Alphaproteobacteria bacterium]|nr:hypothetical protein [Alphaproteobacteria bacterium]